MKNETKLFLLIYDPKVSPKPQIYCNHDRSLKGFTKVVPLVSIKLYDIHSWIFPKTFQNVKNKIGFISWFQVNILQFHDLFQIVNMYHAHFLQNLKKFTVPAKTS